MWFGAGRCFDDVGHILALDRDGEDEMECIHGGVNSFQSVLVKGAGIKGKEYTSFPALAE